MQQPLKVTDTDSTLIMTSGDTCTSTNDAHVCTPMTFSVTGLRCVTFMVTKCTYKTYTVVIRQCNSQ